MKDKDFENLFFSKTRDFLDRYLTNQCSRSPHTVKAYRDAMTVFRRYIMLQGFSIKTFRFEDCTRDFLLGFLEYLQDEYDGKYKTIIYGHTGYILAGIKVLYLIKG